MTESILLSSPAQSGTDRSGYYVARTEGDTIGESLGRNPIG